MPEYRIRYKSSIKVVYSCNYHVIWCPEYRRDVLKHGVVQGFLQ
ncbi:transposase [Orrella marina]